MMIVNRTVAIVMSAILIAPSPAIVSAGAQAPACDAALNKLETETQQLGRDLNADVKEFIKTDVAETSLAGIKNHFKGNPTAEAVSDVKDKWEKFNTYAEYIKNARVTMEDLSRCLNTPGCKLIEFAKRQNEAIAKWIQSLGDEGLNVATERVNKAAKLLQGYVEKTLTTATNGALDTVTKCGANFEQRANTSTDTTQSGGQTNTPFTAPPSTGGGGSSAVWWVLGAAIGGGLAAGTLLKPEDVGSFGGSSTTTGSTTTSTTSTPTFTGATYRVTASRSCQTGSVNSSPLNPGFIEPCNNATVGGSCSPIDFTMSVSGGSVRDCGPWLNGTVSSSGAISAEYNGVCGASSTGVRFSGQLPSSGSSSFTATGTCRGNTYTVQLSISRQ